MEKLTRYQFSNTHVYVLFALLGFLLFFQLNAPNIYILDEARNAQAGREMFIKGDWIVPTFNGELRSHKPVLHYWFMQPAYFLFGETAFAARFFSAVMGMLTVFITFLYCRRLLGTGPAFFSSLALVLSTHFLFEFRLAVPDPYLIFFSTLGSFAAFSYLNQGRIPQLYLAAAAFAFATLAKGPVAIGIPGIALLVWVLWKKKWALVFNWHLVGGAFVFMAVALPWYIAVHQATGGRWTQEFFFEHNFNRFSEEMEGHGGIFLITIAIVVLGMLPFTAYLGELLRKSKTVFRHELVQYSALVTLVFTIFYSVSSTKLPNYPMPCYPFFAVVLGQYIHDLAIKDLSARRYPLFILAAIMMGIGIGGYFAVKQEIAAAHDAWVALLLIVPALMMLVTAFQKQFPWRGIALTYTIFNILFLHFIYPRLYSNDPVSNTIHLVKSSAHVFAYKVYNPGFNFYLEQNVKEYRELDSIKARLMQYPDAVVISRKEFADSLRLAGLKVIASHHDIFELPTTIILKKDEDYP